MCTQAEVKEVVKGELSPILLQIKHLAEVIQEIKAAVKELPCNHLNEEVIKLKLKSESWEGERENIFYRLRKVEDGGSIKIKYIVSIVLSGVVSAGLAILVYKLTR